MPSTTDFPATGKVVRIEDLFVVFTPSNTNYEIKLATAGRYDGPVNTLIEGTIHASARKLWTVNSGGNFVAPIFGPPRIVQGRIKFLDPVSMVLHAGVPIVVKLPAAESAYDLTSGSLSVGTLVNATVLPGATFELVSAGGCKLSVQARGLNTPQQPQSTHGAINTRRDNTTSFLN